jgi:hypothetical protein
MSSAGGAGLPGRGGRHPEPPVPGRQRGGDEDDVLRACPGRPSTWAAIPPHPRRLASAHQHVVTGYSMLLILPAPIINSFYTILIPRERKSTYSYVTIFSMIYGSN